MYNDYEESFYYDKSSSISSDVSGEAIGLGLGLGVGLISTIISGLGSLTPLFTTDLKHSA